MRKLRIIILVIFVFGIMWGFFSNSTYADVDCCHSCTNYCECYNGKGPEYTGCTTQTCSGPDCDGAGVKCCYPVKGSFE